MLSFLERVSSFLSRHFNRGQLLKKKRRFFAWIHRFSFKDQIKKIDRQFLIKLAVILVIAVLMWWWMGARAGVLWFVFLLFFVFKLDDRFVGGAALATLVACPILIFLNKESTAEVVACWSFFLITITVILQIVALVRHPERIED